MIKSIRLINWRSHKDTCLHFRAGTNLLVGIMGAGKSSVMEAISFALFGTFPALERRKMKLENIIRHTEEEARAELEFAWEGEEYRIERTIERSKKGAGASAKFFKNGSLVEQGPVAVSAHVGSIIALDYDIFTRAVYSEQNNIDYFLTLDPKRRKEEIDALLGLDRFEAARASIITVINRVRGQRQALEASFSREKLHELEASAEKSAREKASIEGAISRLKEAHGEQSKELASAQESFEKMKKERALHEQLSRDVLRLSTEGKALARALEGKAADGASLSALETRLKKVSEERNTLAESLKPLEGRISALSKEAGSLDWRMRQCADAKTKLAEAESELRTLLDRKGMEDFENLRKGVEQSVLSMEAERKALERENAELSSTLGRLRPGLSECPLCLSKLTEGGILHVKQEKGRLISEKAARIEHLASSVRKAKSESLALSERIQRIRLLEERMKSLRKDAESAAGLPERKKSLEEEQARLLAERKKLQDESEPLAALGEKLRQEARQMKELIEKKAEADAVLKKLDEANGALSKLAFDEKKHEAARARAEEMRIRAERAQSELKSANAQLKMAADMLALIQAGLAGMKKAAEETASLSALEEELSIYKNALLETQLSLRASLTDAINSAMNEIWPVFYPYRNYRALRLGVSEKDYVFEVDDGGGWRGLETIASGGERACAALALRVALAMVLTPKLGWLILDEPTHNLDSEAVALLSSALEFKVPEVVKQTFVITHDEAFMGSEFASSYRLSRDKDAGEATKTDSL